MAPVAKRKYNKAQETSEELKPHGWLRESSAPGGEAYCYLCRSELKNKIYVLKTHIESARHKSAIEQKSLQASAAHFMKKTPGNYIFTLFGFIHLMMNEPKTSVKRRLFW